MPIYLPRAGTGKTWTTSLMHEEDSMYPPSLPLPPPSFLLLPPSSFLPLLPLYRAQLQPT